MSYLDTPFPQVDIGALKGESAAYKQSCSDLDCAWSNIWNNVTTPLFYGANPWTGAAATACSTLQDGMLSDNVSLTQALDDASSAIDTYVAAATTCRTDYEEADNQARSIAQGYARMNPPQEVAAYKRLNAAGAKAVADLKTAAHIYAGALGDAISAARSVPDRSLGGGSVDGIAEEKNPTRLVDPKLFAMLFGSVIGSNRISGITFENDVLSELGFDKNTTLYEIDVPGKGTIRVIPDGDDDTTVLEVKNVNSLSATRQLLGEIRVAQESGRTPVIVTDDRTTLSGPLKRLAEDGQVKIYQRTAPGEYTNAVTGDEMRADPGNRGIVPKDPGKATDQGTVGEAGDSGGEDGPIELPEQPGGPPPELPEIPETPEIPDPIELPDIIDEIIP